MAAGMRVVGVVAGLNVMRGLPADRTTIGAALADTATEVSSGTGVAVAGALRTDRWRATTLRSTDG